MIPEEVVIDMPESLQKKIKDSFEDCIIYGAGMIKITSEEAEEVSNRIMAKYAAALKGLADK